MRHGGIVRDGEAGKKTIRGIVFPTNVLSAIGIGPDERRRVLGVSVALSEAEVHWRAFLESLVARGMRGVEFIVSDDHSGLRAARRAVLGGATWQRCQFHLARNAIHHAPNAEIRKRIGRQLKSIWDADDLTKAETALAELVASYRDTAPGLADWLEKNVPEALAVFTLPEHHRKRLRTSNPMERSIQQELKRRTVKVRVFPGEDALLRLVSAVLVEIDEKWASDTKAYIKWECQDA
jgi:transposase-like protein